MLYSLVSLSMFFNKSLANFVVCRGIIKFRKKVEFKQLQLLIELLEIGTQTSKSPNLIYLARTHRRIKIMA